MNAKKKPLSSKKLDINIYIEGSKDFADVDNSGDEFGNKLGNIDQFPFAPQQIEEKELFCHRIYIVKPKKSVHSCQAVKIDIRLVFDLKPFN